MFKKAKPITPVTYWFTCRAEKVQITIVGLVHLQECKQKAKVIWQRLHQMTPHTLQAPPS